MVGVYAHINRAYESSEAYQWSREAAVNALQAGATDVRFDVEWQAVRSQQVYRRLVADNGSGMSAQQMPAFLNKFGGSGRTIGAITGNYGVGFKSSVLPWNGYGVVVISVVTLNGRIETNMMWLQREEKDDGTLDYGARELLSDYFDGRETQESDDFIGDWVSGFGRNEDATTVMPLTLLNDCGYVPELDGINWLKVVPKFVKEAGHGTVIVLLGQRGKEHTILGDFKRNEHDTKYGLCRYLNTRFYSIPDNFKITVASVGTEEARKNWNQPSSWPTAPGTGGISSRTVIGMKKCLESYVVAATKEGKEAKRGQTLLKAGAEVPVSVDTLLLPELEKSSGTVGGDNHYAAGNYPSLPLIASIWKCHPDLDLVETFNVRMLSEGKTALFDWINLMDVRRRLALILEPKDDGDICVFADQSRRTLLYQSKTKGGAPLPELEWAAAYRVNRPDFISKAVDAYFEGLSVDRPETDASIVEHLKQYFPFMAHTVVETRRAEKKQPAYERSDESDGDTDSGNRGGYRLPGHLGGRGRDFQNSRGLITVNKGTVEGGFPVEWNTDQKEPRGIVDMTHPLVKDAWDMCELKLRADGVDDGAEMTSYRRAFESQVIGHVSLAMTHIYAYLKANKMKNSDELTKPSALLSIVAGIRHLHQASQGPFGTIKGGRAKVKTACPVN